MGTTQFIYNMSIGSATFKMKADWCEVMLGIDLALKKNGQPFNVRVLIEILSLLK